ncbi:MAG TPA: endolytic transglycosylase MltG [Solirubrobacteraceae bacterium]|nr:endolytic transglycosylase MltG [Solirubrobacteraceae bacterium]
MLALGVLVLVLAGAFVLWSTFQPGHGEGTGAVAVTVPPGGDVGSVGDLLAQRGVIDSPTFFAINATITGRRDELKPGDYTLQRDMSYGAALDALVTGPKAKVVKTFKVTIPEGLSIGEVAPRIRESQVDGNYAAAARSRAVLRRIRKLGAPRGTRTAEGFLFPATYDLVTGSDARDLVSKQLDAFADNFAQVDMRTAKRRNLTRYDVLIIASMVEREAQLDRERPLVAAVIHNRLRDGMTLGIDATIRYAENNWTRPLRVSELERPGPYNTRLNRGLPPTPIGNPGLASLKAAANPARRDYLFYVVKPGTCGEHAFSSTDAEFQRDLARYNAEREAAGGKSPTKC